MRHLTTVSGRGANATGMSDMPRSSGCDMDKPRAAPSWSRVYLCIDLKSFYASVECADLGLDPFTTNLVVADTSRGPGTICLALTPAIKEQGLSGRPRLFQIPPDIRYRAVRPHMRRYMEVSAEICNIYQRFISPDDIHVYSIDECFIDATPYLSYYRRSAQETDVDVGRRLAVMLMDTVQQETRICATAGVGPNLFLAKVALDVLAKHEPSHIGILDEKSFRQRIWHHRPITDIWQIGPGIAVRLARLGAHDLAGVAAIDNATLYREFGVNARHLIEHARGREPCTMAQIHGYRPASTSISVGQVLTRPYTYEEALVVVREMVDEAALQLAERGAACTQASLWVGYEMGHADWELVLHGHTPHAATSRKLAGPIQLRSELERVTVALFREAVSPTRRAKRIGLGFGGLVDERLAGQTLFDDVEAGEQERRLTATSVEIKRRFGKNALVRGLSFREGATARERNEQVGGHHA